MLHIWDIFLFVNIYCLLNFNSFQKTYFYINKVSSFVNTYPIGDLGFLSDDNRAREKKSKNPNLSNLPNLGYEIPNFGFFFIFYLSNKKSVVKIPSFTLNKQKITKRLRSWCKIGLGVDKNNVPFSLSFMFVIYLFLAS